MSQNKLILNYLKAGHTLTPLEALKKFNTWRLSGRILEIRQMGVNVKTETVTDKKTKKRYAKYSIEK